MNVTVDPLLRYAFLIPLAPLVAAALILFFRKALGFQGTWVGVLAMTYAAVHALLIAGGLFTGDIQLPSTGLQGHFYESYVTWFSIGDFDFRLGILIDGLSSLIMAVVTVVSLMVQVYSLSYMRDHVRFGRYFAYVNLFTFAMLTLTVANEMPQLFLGWEIMGLCSYLLIGFDFERDSAAFAGQKAFITTRIGDLGLYTGLLVIFNHLGTFNIPLLHQNLQSVGYQSRILTAIPLLLLCGVIGKSAQVPLHVWLPDAMEGPTPASALIHAATMVAAGIYLVARVFFFFEASPIAMNVAAWIGVITAVMAATMGVVASDLKRMLAFSTVSQLGFMLAALGCGGYAAGIFHLTTHAAFKALLFLCAGSVIHAVHTNDMWKMGGLKTQMPVTASAYLVGTLAISGCWPFSGFFSKDEILTVALHKDPVLFGLLLFASFLTAFYMFRSWFLVFTGLPRDRDRFQHAHESPVLITGPLVVLSFLAAAAGFFFWYQGNLDQWVHWGQTAAVHASQTVFLSATGAFGFGLALAAWVYLFKPPKYAGLAAAFSGPYRVLAARYKFDELYLWLIRYVYEPACRAIAVFDDVVIDRGLIDGVGRLMPKVPRIGETPEASERGTVGSALGFLMRQLQSGLAQSYLFWLAIGLAGMFIWVSRQFR